MRISRGPEGLASLLSESLRGLDFYTRIKEQSCILVWDEVVGEQVAAAAQPEFVRDGKLFVITKSPVWANELTFYKADMISRLNKRVGGDALKDIIFRAGRIRKKAAEPTPRGVESPDLEGIEISEAELDKVNSAVSAAGEAGEGLRQLMITSIRMEKWKRKQGWTPCSRCGALQNTETGICPPCRMG